MLEHVAGDDEHSASMKVRPMPKESAPLIKRSVTEKGYFAYANVAFVADQIRESRHETEIESRGNPGEECPA